jgi:hypothetical protein
MGKTVFKEVLKWDSIMVSTGLYQHSIKMAKSVQTGKPVSSVWEGDMNRREGPPRSKKGLLAANKTKGHCCPSIMVVVAVELLLLLGITKTE